MIVEVEEGKTDLSKLVDQVQKGEQVLIERDGRIVAELVALEVQRERRGFGSLAGQI